jgi:hypothetical protein
MLGGNTQNVGPFVKVQFRTVESSARCEPIARCGIGQEALFAIAMLDAVNARNRMPVAVIINK